MSTLRVSNIEAKADPSSPSIDEKLKVTNSNGDVLVHIDGKTAGITTVGINTTDRSFTVDAAQNVEFIGIVTATKFSLSGGGEITGGDGNFTGIVTATSISATDSTIGVATITSLTASAANFTGNVSIAGTLTYEDVTNVDSIGIATARTGIDVTGGHIDLVDNSKIRVGTGTDLQIYHDTSHSYIEETGTGALKLKGNDIRIENTSSRNVFKAVGTACELFFDNGSTSSKKFETTNTGAVVTGSLTATTFSGNLTGNVTGNTTGNITGNITGESTLPGISSSISDTATDIFVYDTSKDSDGGAWRKRTQNTSWYNETLNTSTRGSRKEFPAVAVIVAEATRVTIYDGDDPDLPMWMKFEPNGIIDWPTNNTTRINISALNGILTTVTNDGGHLFKFVEDFVEIMYSSANYNITSGRTIVDRNNSTSYESVSNTAFRVFKMADYAMNDVTMTVLPNAPIDAFTGLPVPTIAVATDDGLSIIKDDGTVIDGTSASGSNYNQSIAVAITEENYLWWIGDYYTAGGGYLRDSYAISLGSLPTSDFTWNNASDNLSTGTYYALTTGAEGGEIKIGSVNTWAWNIQEKNALGGAAGWAIHKPNLNSASNSLIAAITSDYNTGWMHGNCKGAFLSDTDTTNKTNGQTDPDRSTSNFTLTVTGTITKTPVATGAELVAYGGWGNSHYMDNTSYGVNFGNPVTISIIFWQKITDISDYSYAVSFSEGNTIKGGISNGSSATGYAGEAYFYMGSQTLYTGVPVNDGKWHCLVGTINSNGNVKKFYLDGKEVASDTISNHNMSGISKIHVGSYGVTHAYAHRGSLALLRVSNSVISPEQVEKMYSDEKHLFQENAKATLYGSSNAVTALAYDEVTDQYHVGTSAGRSDFQGLRRINNTTTAVTTAISAHDEFIIEQ